MGRVASRFLQSLPDVMPSLDSASAARLASISLDLVSAAIAEFQNTSGACDTTSRVARRIQIKDYIESHLGDCELSLTSISSALHVSARYLNDLFEQENTSVARHIWSRRLERGHAILQDPAQARRGIGSVAFGLGFNSVSHFGRAFKGRYGVSPSEFRAVALTAART
jgi:AraC-like DNA-binding protein